MEAFKEEIEIGSSAESLLGLLNSQRELFHSQVDQLQDVVVTQCNLTGVNPLAQEMAAGALSIKIGKRPRDLLNPKAVKYMQAVFSIKDAISKKESREISALFGISVSQVRDFFVSQRTRVRRQVRLSSEKGISSNTHAEQQDIVTENYYAIAPSDPVPLSSAPTSAPTISLDPIPLNFVGPTSNGDLLAITPHNDVPPCISDSDKNFAENIFPLMHKEETFSGQVKLMEWILLIQDSSVLIWFLLRGVKILTTWLSQAATEEQTSVILLILKVLCHLPLHKASPENMSAILQSVNGLRFYRIPDISNRARLLLSRWTKLFAKIQAMKKQNRTNSNIDAQSQMLLKQSIEEIMGDGSNTEDFLSPSNGSSETIRRLESSQTPKLLLGSVDDSAKKHMLGPSSSYNRERRKVQLVEQPGQKAAGRSLQPLRTAAANQSRPMSADDIQKAKMRALYLQQGKHGKKDSSPGANGDPKPTIPERPLALQSAKDSPSHQNIEAKTGGTSESSVVQPVNSSAVNVLLRTDDYKKPSTASQNISSKPETLPDLKLKLNPQTILKNCKRIQIAWHEPPEMKLDDLWRVAAGGSSKEVGVQQNRNRREKETIYQSLQEIPLNPKEPWDREMDHDDSLTPEFPSQQPPEESISEPQDALDDRRTTAVSASTSSYQSGALEPDLELLAVLLKNPQLVFELTSGKSGNFAGQDMVKLLDMIKSAGPSSAGNQKDSNNRMEEKVEVSLPSPTPSTDPGTSGWTPGVLRNPFSKQSLSGSTVARAVPQAPVASMQWQAAAEQSQSNPRYVSSVYSSQGTGMIAEKHQRYSTVSTVMERQQIPLQTPAQARSQQNFHHNPHLQQHNIPSNPSLVNSTSYPSREPMGATGTASDSWRSQQSRYTHYSHQANNVASFHGGPSQAYTGNQNVNNPGYESWSPDNSPTSRNDANMRGHRPDWPRKQHDPPHGHWDQNRRWRH